MWYFYFHFLRNLHTDFHSSCIILQPDQQNTEAAISPRPQDHVSFWFAVSEYMCVYFIAAILVVDGSL